jgi:alanine-synthesizing transaminase
VFAEYELVPGAARGSASFTDATDALVFSLGGLSKSVGLPQLKLAWTAVSGPDRLVASALERLEFICDTYLSVATPVQMAARELIASGSRICDQIQGRIRANAADLCARVSRVPACCVLPGQGGWYGVVQVPSFESEEALTLDLLERDGVLVHPGYFFDFPRESFLVVSLLPPQPDFAAGVSRMLRRFDSAGLC